MSARRIVKKCMAVAMIAILLPTANCVWAEEKSDAEGKWDFAIFGTSTNKEDNGYEGSIEDGSVRVYSLNGKGKIVAKSTDGIAYYYTALPTDTNFTLKATGHVNNWFFSNGQEGFGVMAADRVGDGNSAFWNNSFASAVTGYSYMADGKSKINMKIGVNAIERYGVNNDNLYYFDQQNPETIASYFNTKQSPLENYCSAMEPGNYNIVGNSVDAAHPYEEGKCSVEDYTAMKLDTTVKEITDFTLSIQKNNSGYFMSYIDEAGKETTKKAFVIGDDPLTMLDGDNIYVGLFAARNMDVTFEDISLTLVSPEEDAPAETPEDNYITLDEGLKTALHTNQAENDLRYYSNWDGALKIEDGAGNIIYDDVVKSDEYVVVPVTMSEGENVYITSFTPDEDFHYGYDENHLINLYNVLDSYDEVKQKYTIICDSYADLGDTIHVSPEGDGSGDGTAEKPFDIATAARFVQPGQTILLAGGRYEFEEELRLVRGVDGTKDAHITLMTDENAKERAVLDFMKTGKGLVIGGNYWDVKNIEVTGSADGAKGLSVAGSYCTIENVDTYNNGNTGLQVTRYWGYDSKDSGMWPHDVLVKNCFSYDNADSGFEDADGFAAKLTVGDNVVFENCVAHHNADDGWDLFAKSEFGQIGKVTIKNCIAYMNGYIHIDGREDTVAAKLRGNFSQEEGFVADENGAFVNAGNGNGFKLGGEGLKGGHELTGCIAFMNKSNGITSNSCPDVKVSDCISYDNGGSNIALYTGDKVESTDFAAKNVITYRKYTASEKDENIQCKGAQDNSAIISAENYLYNVERGSCENSEGVQITDDNFLLLEMDPETLNIEENADGTYSLGDFLKVTMPEKGVSSEVADTGTSSETVDKGVSNESVDAQTGTGNQNIFAKMISAIKAFLAGVFGK